MQELKENLLNEYKAFLAAKEYHPLTAEMLLDEYTLWLDAKVGA